MFAQAGGRAGAGLGAPGAALPLFPVLIQGWGVKPSTKTSARSPGYQLTQSSYIPDAGSACVPHGLGSRLCGCYWCSVWVSGFCTLSSQLRVPGTGGMVVVQYTWPPTACFWAPTQSGLELAVHREPDGDARILLSASVPRTLLFSFLNF